MTIYKTYECGCDSDDALFDNANYFNDKVFAWQVALHQLLYRKLLKFAYDNGYEDSKEWDDINEHWSIYYNHADKIFSTVSFCVIERLDVYFSSKEGAERAIKEVVEPFMIEHPNFVW